MAREISGIFTDAAQLDIAMTGGTTPPGTEEQRGFEQAVVNQVTCRR